MFICDAVNLFKMKGDNKWLIAKCSEQIELDRESLKMCKICSAKVVNLTANQETIKVLVCDH